MDLALHNVIKGVVVSDKSRKLGSDLGQLVFNVHVDSNKALIARALKEYFKVEVESVRVIVRKGKIRRVKRRIVCDNKTKRAIIKLKEGYSIDLEQAEVVAGGSGGTENQS